jgi:putative membrane protein
MQFQLSRYASISMVVAVCLALGACKGKENAAASDSTKGTTTDTSMGGVAKASDSTAGASASAAGSANGSLSDANIVYLLDEANKADSASGAMALKKATSSDVKSFARMMEGEHHALRVQGQQLAKKLNITPQAPANDPVAPMAQQETSALQSTPKGAQFDKAYIDNEVTVHKAVLDLANSAYNTTQNAQLKALIDKAKPVIQKHYDRAEAIQKKLGGGKTA